MHEPRILLLRALLLDCLGQLLILVMAVSMPASFGIALRDNSLMSHGPWLVFLVLLYPLLGWLFGSYTVLRWRRLALPVLLQRLLLTAAVTFMVVGFATWFINPVEAVWVLNRRVQFQWMTLLTLWALAVRLGLRRGLLLPGAPQMFLLAQPQELAVVLKAWRRVPQRQRLRLIQSNALARKLDDSEEPILLAISPATRQDPSLYDLLARLEMRDPNQVRILSVLSLFEKQQERLPPLLMADMVLAYNDLPWSTPLNVQVQLKRMADLLVSAFLMFLTAPFLLVAALLIWLEDRGPVIYSQQRSGWLGRPFTLYKLRTMTVQPADAPAMWTQPGDQRITVVGGLLRRVRLDELPQLFNVFTGEMSLIGPRPERLELEEALERRIPHYRKRHWMRPGLSGWAQVCAPYASSFEDSDLKLSYDLYYLLHFSSWLDLVILFRTVKTVLKAGGR